MINVPCKDCLKRQVGCHAVCIEYQEYVKEIIAVREKQREENTIKHTVNELGKHRAKVLRQRGKRGRKWKI